MHTAGMFEAASLEDELTQPISSSGAVAQLALRLAKVHRTAIGLPDCHRIAVKINAAALQQPDAPHPVAVPERLHCVAPRHVLQFFRERLRPQP